MLALLGQQLGHCCNATPLDQQQAEQEADFWNHAGPLEAAIWQAMQQQQVSAEKLQGVWVDVGTPERLEQLDQQIMQGVFL